MVKLFHRGQTLATFVEVYRRDTYPSLRANTRYGYDSVLRAHILPVFGGRRLGDVDQRSVQTWVNDLSAAGLSPRTVEACFAVLSTIIGLAAEYGLAAPLARRGRGRSGVRLPKKRPAHREPPTVEQIGRLARVIHPDAGPAFIYTAGFCGLRKSELFGLAPSAIDFEHHRLRVCRTKEQATGQLVDMTKNGKARWVTMTGPVEDALRDHLAARPDADLVFHRNGRSFDSSGFHKRVWRPAREAAGLPGLWLHDLRHAAASIMIAYGWSPKRVQRELGHHTAAFTLDRYTHELERRDDDPGRLELTEVLLRELAAAKPNTLEEATHNG